MKNSSVEAMVRNQYNLSDETDVTVEFQATTPTETDGTVYEYLCRFSKDERNHTLKIFISCDETTDER